MTKIVHDNNQGKRSIFITCTIVLVATLMICVLWVGNISPTTSPFDPTRVSFTTSSGVMMLLCPLLAVWGGTIYFRCSDRTIRRYLLTVVALLIFWLIVCLLKYAARTTLAITLLWYLFYAPMLFIPLEFFFCVLHVSALQNSKSFRTVKLIALAISGALLLLVLTNNFHFQVFAFDYNMFYDVSPYSYKWGYFTIIAWIALLMMGSFALIALNARSSLLPALLLIVGVSALIAVYSALYFSRFAVVFASNITLVCTVFIVAIAEMCLQLKLLPTYPLFHQLFFKLPFDAKIINTEGTVVMQSNCAQELLPQAKALCMEMIEQGEIEQGTEECSTYHMLPASFQKTAWHKFVFPSDPCRRYCAFQLSGGLGLFTEDITPIAKNQQRLEKLEQKLLRQNMILQQDGVAKSQLYRQQRLQELYEEICATLSVTVSEIAQRINNLPNQSSPLKARQRKRELLIVKMLVAYCKRKGNLTLYKAGTDSNFDSERISLMISETAADLRAAGIECAALVETSARLPVETVSILYDCFYDFCMAAFYYENPALIVFLRDAPNDENAVEMRLALESDCLDEGDAAREDAGVREVEAVADAAREDAGVCEGEAVGEDAGKNGEEKDEHIKQALTKLQETLASHNITYALNRKIGSLNLTVLVQKKTMLQESATPQDATKQQRRAIQQEENATPQDATKQQESAVQQRTSIRQEGEGGQNE